MIKIENLYTFLFSKYDIEKTHKENHIILKPLFENQDIKINLQKIVKETNVHKELSVIYRNGNHN